MKLKLIKEIKQNGDIYYTTYLDDVAVSGTITWAGTVIEPKEGAVEVAMARLKVVKELLLSNEFPSQKEVYSEEI